MVGVVAQVGGCSTDQVKNTGALESGFGTGVGEEFEEFGG